jgi:hypothetical protein
MLHLRKWEFRIEPRACLAKLTFGAMHEGMAHTLNGQAQNAGVPDKNDESLRIMRGVGCTWKRSLRQEQLG